MDTPRSTDSIRSGEILQRYEQLEASHRQMLEEARQENWEAAAALVCESIAIQAELEQIGSPSGLGEATQDAVRECIVRTQSLIGELHGMATPALKAHAALLADNAQRSKIASAYGA